MALITNITINETGINLPQCYAKIREFLFFSNDKILIEVVYYVNSQARADGMSPVEKENFIIPAKITEVDAEGVKNIIDNPDYVKFFKPNLLVGKNSFIEIAYAHLKGLDKFDGAEKV